MLENKKILINRSIIFLLIIFSLVIKLSFVKSFFYSLDDQISVISKLRYENFSIYDISNDSNSATYNSNLKKFIREVQSKKNKFYDGLEIVSSKILVNISPAKNSTYAPMQYLMFSWLIKKDHNYEQLKLYSRLPSIFFSICTIILTYILSIKVFRKDNSTYILPTILVCISYPLLYTSLRSYNYASGTFAVTLFFLLTYFEMFKNNNYFLKISEKNLSFKKNFLVAILFCFLAYLNYVILVIIPIYFIINFKYAFSIKKIFSKYNVNLFIVGILYSIFISPLITYILIMNLNKYGISESAAGEFGQYHLSEVIKESGLKDIIFFYINNFYLIFSKNLSFFLDNFYLSKLLQIIISIMVILGIFVSFKEDENLNKFSKLSIIFFLYYIFLVYFEILSLGPSRHSTFYVPMFAILFSISFQKIFIKIFEKIYDKIIYFFLIFSTCIFLISYNGFVLIFKDPFSEKNLNKLIKKYNVAYIYNNPSLSNQVCIMNITNTKIRTCPNLYKSRYAPKYEIKQLNFETLKSENKSIMIINNTEILNEDKKYLKDNDFKLVKKINDSKFDQNNSPLYITANKLNLYEVLIYK